ncbi:MAG: SRPBCC family protein [Chloroflexi bacterium]|nr:SRPBCC family protein [Chloroflexota bacterium]
MPQVERSIEIAAPPTTVFGFIANQPERQPEWWTAFDQQERVTPAPTTLGSVSRYVYNMLGIKIKGEHEVKAIAENEHLLVTTTSGIESTFEFTFRPSGEHTHLTVRVDYTLPGSVLGQLLNRLTIEQRNERDLETALNNLKSILENTPNTGNTA